MNYRQLLLFGFLLTLYPVIYLQGQDDNPVTSYGMDVIVPDAPAFNLLDENPSNILRPTTVREFGIAFSQFIDSTTGDISLPQTFAIEFSPGLLIGGNRLTIKDYQAFPLLYRLRLSAGMRRKENASQLSEMAIGVRVNIFDNSDLRTNNSFLTNITAITDTIRKIAKDTTSAPPRGVSGAEEITISDSRIDARNDAIRKEIENVQDSLWNKSALDVAAAVLFSEKDSISGSLQVSNWTVWGTWSIGIGTWGQWLLGVTAAQVREPDSTALLGRFSPSTRFYFGRNNYKMFLEAQWTAVESHKPGLLINGGGEIKVSNSFWLSFSGGMERDENEKEWQFVNKFDVKLGLPFLNWGAIGTE